MLTQTPRTVSALHQLALLFGSISLSYKEEKHICVLVCLINSEPI